MKDARHQRIIQRAVEPAFDRLRCAAMEFAESVRDIDQCSVIGHVWAATLEDAGMEQCRVCDASRPHRYDARRWEGRK